MASFMISSIDMYENVDDLRNDPLLNELIDTSDSNDITNDMIIYRTRKASLPVIITAPHGGYSEFGNQCNRLIERDTTLPGVIIKKDLFTLELSAIIDQYIRNKTNKSCHYVSALFHRKYIDANRNDTNKNDHAYNDNDNESKRIYNNYHQKISDSISHINTTTTNSILLLDIHGFRDPYYQNSIVIGTRNYSSADSTVVNERWSGFCFHLRHIMGNQTQVLPLLGESDISKYSGAGTLEQHGQLSKPRVNAIQLEFAFELRMAQRRTYIGELLGEAIIRTLFPMPFFIQIVCSTQSINWCESDKEVVNEKLKRIGVIKPSNLIQGEVNTLLTVSGFKRFRETTLKKIKNVYQEEDC